MNRLPLLLLIALCLFDAARAQQPGATAAPAPPPNPSLGTPPHGGAQLPQITQAEWQELRAARAAALQSDHELTANNQAIMAHMQALEGKVEAAMIKSDPTLAPIIAKLAAARHPPGTPPGPAPVMPITAPPPPAK